MLGKGQCNSFQACSAQCCDPKQCQEASLKAGVLPMRSVCILTRKSPELGSDSGQLSDDEGSYVVYDIKLQQSVKSILMHLAARRAYCNLQIIRPFFFFLSSSFLSSPHPLAGAAVYPGKPMLAFLH